MNQHHKVRCLETGRFYADDGLILAGPDSTRPAFIRAEYDSRQLTVKPGEPGIFRFSDWLPVHRSLPAQGWPVTWRSERLGKHLGLERLYLTFSGYWPEMGANMTTGTFKECEAYAVCARYPENCGKVLVVASAGNTARAFLKVASENRIPLVVVVPQMCLGELWQERPLQPWVRIVVSGGDSDYFDAISLADRICQVDGYQAEGGAKNIARRDGMGTTVLSAATTIGTIPDCYYQAIGSGTGAIAAWEANLRLINDGRFGNRLMSLRLSQNMPFVPIYTAWQKKSRDIAPIPTDEARDLSRKIKARVLANRKPPYGPIGGLYDALQATGGHVMAISNEALTAAQALFAELEGCDICPEAGVALASLIQEAENGLVDPGALIMLNITGGGIANIQRELQPQPVTADLVVEPDAAPVQDIEQMFIDLRTDLLRSL
jgi:cysteate synthase